MSTALRSVNEDPAIARPAEHRPPFMPSARTPALILCSLAIIWAIGWAKDFLIPLTLAVFLTCCLAPIVSRLARMRIPRPLGAALALLGALSIALWAANSLKEDARAVLDELPGASAHLSIAINNAMNDSSNVLNRIKVLFGSTRRTEPVPMAAALAGPTVVTDVPAAVVAGTKRVASLASKIVVVLFLVYFLLSSGDLLRHKLARLLSLDGAAPTRTSVRILTGVSAQLQRYTWVVISTNTVLGIAIWLAFLLLGVEHAGVWGVAAGLLHVIPYLGPAVMAVASGLAASMQFDSVSQGLLVAGVTVLISTFFGMVLTAWLAGRAASMNMAAVFVSLLFWGWLWGLPGLLLGTPITMAVKVLCDHTESMAWMGDLLGDAAPPSRQWRRAATEMAKSDT